MNANSPNWRLFPRVAVIGIAMIGAKASLMGATPEDQFVTYELPTIPSSAIRYHAIRALHQEVSQKEFAVYDMAFSIWQSGLGAASVKIENFSVVGEIGGKAVNVEDNAIIDRTLTFRLDPNGATEFSVDSDPSAGGLFQGFAKELAKEMLPLLFRPLPGGVIKAGKEGDEWGDPSTLANSSFTTNPQNSSWKLLRRSRLPGVGDVLMLVSQTQSLRSDKNGLSAGISVSQEIAMVYNASTKSVLSVRLHYDQRSNSTEMPLPNSYVFRDWIIEQIPALPVKASKQTTNQEPTPPTATATRPKQ